MKSLNKLFPLTITFFLFGIFFMSCKKGKKLRPAVYYMFIDHELYSTNINADNINFYAYSFDEEQLKNDIKAELGKYLHENNMFSIHNGTPDYYLNLSEINQSVIQYTKTYTDTCGDRWDYYPYEVCISFRVELYTQNSRDQEYRLLKEFSTNICRNEDVEPYDECGPPGISRILLNYYDFNKKLCKDLRKDITVYLHERQ